MKTKFCFATFLFGMMLCKVLAVATSSTSTSMVSTPDTTLSPDTEYSSSAGTSTAGNTEGLQADVSTPSRLMLVLFSLSTPSSSTSLSSPAFTAQNQTTQFLPVGSQRGSHPVTQSHIITDGHRGELQDNSMTSAHSLSSDSPTASPWYAVDSSSWGPFMDQSTSTITGGIRATDVPRTEWTTVQSEGRVPIINSSSGHLRANSAENSTPDGLSTETSPSSTHSVARNISEIDQPMISSSSPLLRTTQGLSNSIRHISTPNGDVVSSSTSVYPSKIFVTTIPFSYPVDDMPSSRLPTDNSEIIDPSPSSAHEMPVTTSADVNRLTASVSLQGMTQSLRDIGLVNPTSSSSFTYTLLPQTDVDYVFSSITPSVSFNPESSDVEQFLSNRGQSGTVDIGLQSSSTGVWSEASFTRMTLTESISSSALFSSSLMTDIELSQTAVASVPSTAVSSPSTRTPSLIHLSQPFTETLPTSSVIVSIVVDKMSASPVTSAITTSSSQTVDIPSMTPSLQTPTTPVAHSPRQTPAPNQTTTTSSTTMKTTTKPATQDVRYLFIMAGDCHLILNNTEFFQRFLAGFHDLIVKQMRITEDSYKLGEISCGSVRVYVTFLQVVMPHFDTMLQTIIHNGGPGLSVPVWIDSHFATFDLTHAKRVPLAPDEHTYNIVTQVMDDVDIIVIIVACCVCGVLIAIGVAICVKECYRRKHAQSFNLLEVPHVNLKLEDFTLTRIPRPRTIYKEATPKKTKPEGGYFPADQTDIVVAATNGHPSRMSNGRLHPSDMHLRVKQHSDGIIVGITASTGSTSSPSSETQSQIFTVGTARRSKSKTRTPSGDDCPTGEGQASQHLLAGHNQGDTDGMVNPVFVDEQEEEEGGGPPGAL